MQIVEYSLLNDIKELSVPSWIPSFKFNDIELGWIYSNSHYTICTGEICESMTDYDCDETVSRFTKAEAACNTTVAPAEDTTPTRAQDSSPEAGQGLSELFISTEL